MLTGDAEVYSEPCQTYNMAGLILDTYCVRYRTQCPFCIFEDIFLLQKL